jgi:hypothetical protein
MFLLIIRAIGQQLEVYKWNAQITDMTRKLLETGYQVLLQVAVYLVVGRYGRYGQGIESWWWRDFPHPPRSALGPTQFPVQWVPRLFRPG